MDYFSNTVNIHGSVLSNLRFAEDTDLLGGTETELQEQTTIGYLVSKTEQGYRPMAWE